MTRTLEKFDETYDAMTTALAEPTTATGPRARSYHEIVSDDGRQSDLAGLLAHLHRGGDWWCLFTKPPRAHTFYATGTLPPIPTGQADVWFSVNPLTTKKRGNATTAAINCVYGDFDVKDFGSKAAIWAHWDTLPIKPSAIIDSGGGYHAYWLLRDPLVIRTDDDRQRAADILAGWVGVVGADPGAKDLARILRYPGTRNYKSDYAPDFPMVTVELCDLYRLYDLGEIEALIEGAQPEPEPEPEPAKTTTSETTATIESDPIRKADYAKRALTNAADMIRGAQDGEKHTRLLEASRLLGGYIAGGIVAERDAIALLEGEIKAKPNVKSLDDAYKTIQAGIDHGKGDPITYEMEEKKRLAYVKQLTTTTGYQGQRSAPSEPEPPPRESDNGEDQTRMLLGLPADDEGNAQCMKYLRGGEFLNTEAYGWLNWKGTHWGRKHAEPRLERAITETLLTRRLAAVQNQREAIVKIAKPSAHRVRATKFMFRSLALAEVGDFDAHPDLLNCQNGVVNLRTGELTPHHPSQRFTYVLPIPYHPDAEAKEWLAYLGDVLNHDADIITYLQQALGYSLTGWTQEEILFYLYGPTRSGKGTFTETVLAMLGKPLSTEVNFETFTAKRYGDTQNFDLAPLKPCRFVAASESSKYAPLNAAKIKQLTGGNDVYCAFKGKTHFGYRPQFKIWLSSNHDVNADVDDDAAWYRLRVVHFPNCYAGREDKGLKHRLRTPESLAGILAWAVEGAKAWYRLGNKGLVTPEQVTADTKGARSKLDFVQQWLDECIKTTKDPEDFVSSASLYTSYEDWCQDNGVTPKKQRSLGLALGRKGFTSKRKKVAGVTRRGWAKIQLRG